MKDYEDYKKELRELEKEDCETAHWRADEILCEILKDLGYTEIVELWDEVCKWYA